MLYEAARLGAPSPLPGLPLQFPDWAVWQRRWLESDGLAAQLAYWQERLAGQSGSLNLPAGPPATGRGDLRGARERVELPPGLVNGLRQLGHGSGATLFVTLMAALQALLGRFAGQPDVAVGTAVANRHREEVERLIGCFVNLLVIATEVDGRTPFRPTSKGCATPCSARWRIRTCRSSCWSSAWRRRGSSPPPAVPGAVPVPEHPAPRVRAAGAALRSLEVPTATSRFDLTLTLIERGEGLTGSLEYSTDLFDRATAGRLLLAWRTLLDGLVGAPRRPLAELPLLPAGPRHQILLGWNDTRGPLPAGGRLLESFARRAAREPEAVVLIAGDEQLTAGELAGRADLLARALRDAGCGPETVVGIHLRRSPDLVASLLAVLQAGGAYLPLDPSYPPSGCGSCSEDSGAPLLLTESALAGGLRIAGCRELLVDRLPPPAPERAPGRPSSRIPSPWPT